MSNTLGPHGLQHAWPPYPLLSPGVCSNSGPLSQWCHPTTSSSVTPFSSLQSFAASGSFPMSWLFTSGGQSIGALASASVFPMNIQGRFTLELTGLFSLLPKGLSRVFSSTRVQKHQCHVKWQMTIATISWIIINASYHCLAFLCQTYLLYAHFYKIISTIPASYQQYTHLKIMKMEFWRQWDVCLRHVVRMSSVARTIAPN